MINVDTDMIIPKQFLKTIKRSGLGKNLFDEMRYDDSGAEKPDFVLNRAAYRHASILVAGDNFGCGSSRAHAPWALLDFGIRCVIATSFADMGEKACNLALDEGFAKEGDRIVVTAGVPFGTPGSTNTLRIALVGQGG